MTGENLGRILIVDDESELLRALCEALGREGYETECFASGEDALEAMSKGRFDILLTDLMMPGMDGISLLRSCLDIDPDLVGIVMTGQGTVATAVSALKTGAFDYLQKPFKMSAVLPILARAREVRRLKRENLQLRHIALVNEISRSMLERHNLEGVLQVVAERLEESLAECGVAVMLKDGHTGKFSISILGARGSRILSDMGLREGMQFTARELLLPELAREKILYFPDLLQTDSLMTGKLSAAGVRSRVVCLLMVEGAVIGTVSLVRRETDGFTPEERQFLSDLSLHISLAIHHAALYGDLENAYNEIRRTKLEILQQERLRALGQMASGIVHDINNALTPIAGYTDLLLLDEKKLDGATREYLNIIQLATGDIINIVARMRTFSRKRGDEEALLPLDVNSAIRQAVDLTRPRWKDIPQERGNVVTIHCDLQSNLAAIMGVETEMREALINLILNAVDAMPQGGTLSFRTYDTVAEGGGRESGFATKLMPQTVIEVTDTGVGMDEKTRTQCLEPFFTTKGENGTGLGLSMIFGIVERHGGEITIESEPGRGTTVRLTFPAAGGETRAGEAAAPVRCPAMRILCIDDDPLVRVFLKRALETEGHRVDAVDGGEAGLDAFRCACGSDAPFELVVTDLGMPHVDGRTVAREVKRISPRTPVIVLSGWAEKFGSEEGQAENIEAVLAKPPKINELLSTIARVSLISV